jgi:hypothetical protein
MARVAIEQGGRDAESQHGSSLGLRTLGHRPFVLLMFEESNPKLSSGIERWNQVAERRFGQANCRALSA